MTVETGVPVDLVDKTVAAAEAAICQEAAVLTGDPRAWGEWKGTIRRRG